MHSPVSTSHTYVQNDIISISSPRGKEPSGLGERGADERERWGREHHPDLKKESQQPHSDSMKKGYLDLGKERYLDPRKEHSWIR
jgi:hypothetical protein